MLPPKEAHSIQPNAFDDLSHALDMIRPSTDITKIVFKVIAAILHLCNLEFEEDSSANAYISDDVLSNESLSFAAQLFQIDPVELEEAITIRKFKTHSNEIQYAEKIICVMPIIV